MCAHVYNTQPWRAWSQKTSLQEPVLSFRLVGSRDQPWANRLCGKNFYPLSPLTGLLLRLMQEQRQDYIDAPWSNDRFLKERVREKALASYSRKGRTQGLPDGLKHIEEKHPPQEGSCQEHVLCQEYLPWKTIHISGSCLFSVGGLYTGDTYKFNAMSGSEPIIS